MTGSAVHHFKNTEDDRQAEVQTHMKKDQHTGRKSLKWQMSWQADRLKQTSRQVGKDLQMDKNITQTDTLIGRQANSKYFAS